uniref:Uncharacterized protein n=1 Tax=Anguilla anguilla TaxID=7936 RepID=A0A0E9U8G8_ANGAN
MFIFGRGPQYFKLWRTTWQINCVNLIQPSILSV